MKSNAYVSRKLRATKHFRFIWTAVLNIVTLKIQALL